MHGSRTSTILSARRLAFLLLLVVSQFTCSFALRQQTFYVFIPPTIYVEHENLIQVRTLDHASMARLITSAKRTKSVLLDEQEFPIRSIGHGLFGVDIAYKPTVLPPAGKEVELEINITITFCENPDCSDTVDVTQRETVWLARRAPMILSEIEKPMYRPGETVRFRFVALRPEVTVPLPTVFQYPTRILRQSTSSEEFEVEDYSEERQSGLKFDEIFVTDSENNRVKQWFNVTPLVAAQLKHNLLADDPQGTWRVTAKLAGLSETVSFIVQHYVLPRFVIDIQTPGMLRLDSDFAEFAVCAKYTNGPPMLGTVRAVLCVCDERTTGDSNLLDNQTCPVTRWVRSARPCVETLGQLQRDGCASFNVSTKQLKLNNDRYYRWGQASIVCAEVLELGTGANVTKCAMGKALDLGHRKLKLKFPSVYKRGLPVLGTVTVDNFDKKNVGKAWVTVSLTESHGGCWWGVRQHRLRDGPQFSFLTSKLVSADGTAQIFIPSIESNYTINMEAIYHLPKSDSPPESNASETSAPFHHHTPGLSGYHTLRPFVPMSANIFAQQWPMQTPLTSNQCPGVISITMIANTPLHNKTIYLQAVVRGKVIQEQVLPSFANEPVCRDQDGLLGHYTCLKDESDIVRIQCKAGWTGPNCMYPACSHGCHATGGFCYNPNTCVCKPGWEGKHCDQCMKRPGCVHGRCVQGDDCVCEPGWDGLLCNSPEVVYEPVPEDRVTTLASIDVPQVEEITDETVFSNQRPARSITVDENRTNESSVVSRKTIYERNISLQVDDRWGPEATVLVYFYEDRAGELDIVPMTITITGLENCTNPASVLQAKSDRNGIHFDKYVVSPGQPLQMTVGLHGLNESMRLDDSETGNLSDQVCFVRISDLALSNFEQATSTLNWKEFAAKFRAVERGSSWRPEYPTDVSETFQAAGIRLVRRPVLEYVHTSHYMCQLFSSSASDSVFAMRNLAMPIHDEVDSESSSDSVAPPKPRLRDFFPEVWLFDVISMENLAGQKDEESVHGFRRNLTAPDSITTWRASAYCTTHEHGLWIPPSKQLTVQMPFFVELTLPKQVKRGEILYLPVSLFATAHPSGETQRDCLEVLVTSNVDDADWLRVGVSSFTGCVCPGQKETFQLGLLAKGLGMLNVTVEAYATTGSELCNANQPMTAPRQKEHTLSDMIRRQVRVVPEGKPKEMTIGTMFCLKPNRTQVLHEFHIPSIPNVIPGSLRLYVSYSDEVLGPALRNLGSLVRLPMGCGEQNMLLVAPNVYVLDYLKAVPVVNAKETAALVRTARSYIASGYKRQLNYRLRDGSYSAFGEADGQGSTWLTAFVLRVFARAYKTDPTVDVDWTSLMNETANFLVSRMTSVEHGCFVEKGRVIHADMQGGLDSSRDIGKSLLLTSYILAALHEMDGLGSAVIPTLWTASRRDSQACMYHLLEAKLAQSENMHNFDTYELAQVAYTMALLYPNHPQTHVMQQELSRRQELDTSGSGDRLFWTAKQESNVRRQSAAAADIETTCYAYLALTQTSPPLIDPLAVIRWLSTQQTASGGFRSTQDTTLALQVIADAAKRLGLSNMSASHQEIEVMAGLHPNGAQIRDTVTVDKRRVLNRFAIPVREGQHMEAFLWNISRSDTGGTQCLVVQNTLYYNVPESSDLREPAFAISINPVQSNIPTVADCRVANLSICVRPGSARSMQRDSGMLLVQVHMISGWNPIVDRLLAALGNHSEAPRKVELDSDKGTTSVYFDGFSNMEAEKEGGWSQLKRCFTLDVGQGAYVKNAEPGRVTAFAYYDTGRSVESTYMLNACKGSWGLVDIQPEPEPERMTTVQPQNNSTTTPRPTICPVCGMDAKLNSTMVALITKALCRRYSDLFLLNVRRSGEDQLNVTMITITVWNQTASWNATLNSASVQDCPCASLVDGAKLILIAPSELRINPGQASVSLSDVVPRTLLVPAGDIMWAVEEAMTRRPSDVVTESKEPEDGSELRCGRIPLLYRYLKYKFL